MEPEIEEAPRPIQGGIVCDLGFDNNPQWGEIYQILKGEAYIEPIMDPREQDLDIEVFHNIKRSYLHNVAARLAVMTCANIIYWLIDHVDIENRL